MNSADAKQATTSKFFTIRRTERGRLVYYAAAASSEYWDNFWRQYITPQEFAWAEQGRLPEIEAPVKRYLPKQGRVLEAGCGPGWYVLALRQRGYDAEGVEYAEQIVEQVKKLYPNLPIHTGDVTRLSVTDEYYAAYISLGVVEHRFSGPEPFLCEAYRVLQDRGIMLISVPSFHVLRRIKARFGFYRNNADGLEFYQYAFKTQEFLEIIRQHSFEILDVLGYDAAKGLKDEIPLFRWILKQGRVGRRVGWLINKSPLLCKHVGHMILVVARKI